MIGEIPWSIINIDKNNYVQYQLSMNEIINKFLLAGDKFMSEMHLRQLRFTYSPCGPFAKNKERI